MEKQGLIENLYTNETFIGLYFYHDGMAWDIKDAVLAKG